MFRFGGPLIFSSGIRWWPKCGVAILSSQHPNATTTQLRTHDDDIFAFEHASIAFE